MSVKTDIFFSLFAGYVNPYHYTSANELLTLLKKYGLLWQSEFDYYLSRETITMYINNKYTLHLEKDTEFNCGIVLGLECIYFLDDKTDNVYDITYDFDEIRIRRINLQYSGKEAATLLGRAKRLYKH